jgi:hypothetical protein
MREVKKNLIQNNFGLAGVIEALLLVGLVAVILSTIQLAYIPEVMKQKETDHLDDVEKQFAQIKSVTETQSMMGIVQTDETIAYSPMSSPLTLGTKKLPYFVTSNSLGFLKIIDKDDAININITVNSTGYKNSIPLTSIRYTFYSMYQGYNTNYIYEGGGIIRNQTGGKYNTGEAMRINPVITTNYSSENNLLEIYYYIPVFNCAPGKEQIQGLDLTYIRTNYTRDVSYTGILSDPDQHSIKIFSDYLDAWNKSFMDDRVGILWEYANDRDAKGNYVNVTYEKTQNPPYIKISPSEKDIKIYFTKVELGIQLGLGTILS